MHQEELALNVVKKVIKPESAQIRIVDLKEVINKETITDLLNALNVARKVIFLENVLMKIKVVIVIQVEVLLAAISVARKGIWLVIAKMKIRDLREVEEVVIEVVKVVVIVVVKEVIMVVVVVIEVVVEATAITTEVAEMTEEAAVVAEVDPVVVMNGDPNNFLNPIIHFN
jgi:hypothetical protein